MSKIFKTIKSIPTEIKSAYFFTLAKTLNLEMNIGANIIVSPSKTDKLATQNQLPFV